MKREFGLEQIRKDVSSVVTVGTFDGVHVGHQAILHYLVGRAKERRGSSVVVSFDPHPREIVHGEEVPLLTTVDERADVMEQVNVDRFIVIPFTEAFSRLLPEEFVETVLVRKIGLREIVIGYDHAFGRGRRGDADLLEKLGRTHGFSVDVIPAQVVKRHVVSSSEIRSILTNAGDVALAAQMLGRPYRLCGTVVRGDGRGRSLGFPTANIRVSHPRKVIPATGVYAVHVALCNPSDGETIDQLAGMTNIGTRPTFGQRDLSVEAHVFDLDRDLYGQDLCIEFVARLREERKFDSAASLVEQLSRDRERCMQLLTGHV